MDVILVLQLLVERALTLHGEQVARDRKRDILLAHPRQLDVQHELVLRLVHVEHGRPRARACRGGDRPPEEAVEEAVHLALDIGHVAERLPTLDGCERTPTLQCHTRFLLLLLSRSSNRVT